MPTRAAAHLTLSGRPYCDHLACMAGLSLAKDADVHQCDYASTAAANRAARQLRAHTSRPVRVVPGLCEAV